MGNTPQPIIQLKGAALSRGGTALWQGLTTTIMPGEFIAVLGPNGAGKSSLLQVLLGFLSLQGGTAHINGHAPRKGDSTIGYIPQQKSFDATLPVRGRDLVALGLSGAGFGFGGLGANDTRVDEALSAVGATSFANSPIGLLSGGQQQRLRIAQALVGKPRVLLCDEPLLSLDLASQKLVTELLDSYRKATNAAVIFVTHEINPILPWVDRVLYIAKGKTVIDTPENVLQSAALSAIYGSPVEVLTVHGRVIVIAADDPSLPEGQAHHEEHHS